MNSKSYTFTFKCGNCIWWKIVVILDEDLSDSKNDSYSWDLIIFADEREILHGEFYTNVPWFTKRDCAKWIQSSFGNLAITCAIDAKEI